MDLELARKQVRAEIDELKVTFEELYDKYDDHIWSKALSEIGYVEDHGPDIDGIASSLIERCAGNMGISPQQFAWWGRKYGWIAPRYTELDAMISDVINCSYNAWLITYHQKDSEFYKDLWMGVYGQDQAA